VGKALRWREDVDMIARTITVNQQTCEGETTTPKGRTRRTWLGHKRIDETMRYVHVAEAARAEPVDPDRRIVAMLGARAKFLPKTEGSRNEKAAVSAA
jgi:hypothetical protein